MSHLCDRAGDLDRSLCGACHDPFIACSTCGTYTCACFPEGPTMTTLADSRASDYAIVDPAYFKLSTEERVALWRASDHHPEICDCSAYMPLDDDLATEGCAAFYATVAAVEKLMARRFGVTLPPAPDLEPAPEPLLTKRAAIGHAILMSATHVQDFELALEECGYTIDVRPKG